MLAWLPFLQHGVLESWVSPQPPFLTRFPLPLQFLLPVGKLHLANVSRVSASLQDGEGASGFAFAFAAGLVLLLSLSLSLSRIF